MPASASAGVGGVAQQTQQLVPGGQSFQQQVSGVAPQTQGGGAALQHHQPQQQYLQSQQPQAQQVPRGARPCSNPKHDPSKGGDPAARCSYSHAHWSAPAQGGTVGSLKGVTKKK